MKNIIEKDKSSERLIFNSTGNLFLDGKYLISLSVCGDVFCDCGASVINILQEDGTIDKGIGVSVPIDIHTKKIRDRKHKDYFIEDKKNEGIVDLLRNSFTKSDWKLLKERYYKNKFIFIEQVDPKKIEYDFQSSYAKNDGMMFPYKEAFPCSEFRISIEEENYVILDDYCKTPTCNCKEIYLTVLKESAEEGNHNVIELGRSLYNYELQKAENIEGNDKDLVGKVISEVKVQIPLLDKIIGRRHWIIKELFEKSLVKNKQKTENIVVSTKIGRNDLCPCGSGKKYKKCCLN